MPRISRAAGVATAALLASFAFPCTASALESDTWVSGSGKFTNPCTRALPCTTFAKAVSETRAKGNVNVLSSGRFGAVTITKSISIRARGNSAVVSTNSSQGIAVDAGPNARVTLSGLTLHGFSGGAVGVRIVSGSVVRIEDCAISGWALTGVSFMPSTTGARLVVQDTTIHGNSYSAAPTVGVHVKPAAPDTAVTIRRSHIDDNPTGVSAEGTTRAAIVNIFRSAVLDNVIGLSSVGPLADIRIGGNDITGNTTALLSTNGGKITSFGTNHLFGNITDGSPTSTTLPR